MSLIRSLMAKGGMSFAHLGGIKAGKARSAESDKDDDDKDDDQPGKDAKADGEDPKDENDKDDSGKGSKAEGDGDKKDDDGKDDDKSKSAKGAKSAKADDDDAKADDDDEEEMRGKSAAASARRRERARCATIFGSKAAGRNPVLAANLAFNTSMTRSEALAVLEGTPAPQQASAQHAQRAANNPRVDPPGAPEQNAEAAVLSSWDAARARNKRQGG